MDELLSGMEGMLSPHYCVCRGGGGGGGAQHKLPPLPSHLDFI